MKDEGTAETGMMETASGADVVLVWSGSKVEVGGVALTRWCEAAVEREKVEEVAGWSTAGCDVPDIGAYGSDGAT